MLAGTFGRGTDAVQQVQSGHLGAGHFRMQVKGPAQQPEHLRRPARRVGRLGAEQRPPVRLFPMPGLVVVVGQGHGQFDVDLPGGTRLQDGGEGGVPGPPLLRQQPVLEYLGQQRVGEPVPSIRTDVEHPGIDRLTQQRHGVAGDPG